jgi:uncharacterized protein (TIGR03118 family)
LHFKATVQNLVSNGAFSGRVIDARLVNGWGIVEYNGTLWVTSNNGAGQVLNYALDGTILPTAITVPGGSPTGIIVNNTAGFLITNGPVTLPATLLIATEEGLVLGYNAAVDPVNAIVVIDRSGVDAVYTGLAIANNRLFVADFFNRRIDVFDAQYNLLAGYTFTDPSIQNAIPFNYAPFNIVNIDNRLFVTYAQQLAPDNEVIQPGAGNGIINIFDFYGAFVRRLVTGGALNAPWGLAVAPNNWGDAACKLLVANFGDGRINVYDFCGKFLGYLRDRCGRPVFIDGISGLINYRNRVYFTAGPGAGTGGLVGVIRKPGCHDYDNNYNYNYYDY